MWYKETIIIVIIVCIFVIILKKKKSRETYTIRSHYEILTGQEKQDKVNFPRLQSIIFLSMAYEDLKFISHEVQLNDRIVCLYSLPHCVTETLQALPPPTPHRCLCRSQKVPVKWHRQFI